MSEGAMTHLDFASILNLVSTAAIVGALVFTALQVRAARAGTATVPKLARTLNRSNQAMPQTAIRSAFSLSMTSPSTGSDRRSRPQSEVLCLAR